MTKKWPRQNPGHKHPLEAERDKLKSINVDLLAALKGIMTAHIEANIAEVTTPALKQASREARAAIAKARN